MVAGADAGSLRLAAGGNLAFGRVGAARDAGLAAGGSIAGLEIAAGGAVSARAAGGGIALARAAGDTASLTAAGALDVRRLEAGSGAALAGASVGVGLLTDRGGAGPLSLAAASSGAVDIRHASAADRPLFVESVSGSRISFVTDASRITLSRVELGDSMTIGGPRILGAAFGASSEQVPFGAFAGRYYASSPFFVRITQTVIETDARPLGLVFAGYVPFRTPGAAPVPVWPASGGSAATSTASVGGVSVPLDRMLDGGADGRELFEEFRRRLQVVVRAGVVAFDAGPAPR